MGKVIFWLVVVFVVLLGLRLLNVASAKRRRDEAAAASRKASAGDRMVRCIRCGLYLPQAEAASSAAGYVCADGRCAERR